MDADLVLVHGFWSSSATWDRLIPRLRDDPQLVGLRIHPFGYESPKLRWPRSPARIPDYTDIAQSMPAYLATYAPGATPIAIVTHSQGGLILQRYLAWMLTEGRGRELARFRLVVLLSCPNEGSEYLRSIRAAVGFNHHPQAGQLKVLEDEVGQARRIVLRQVVNATTVDDRHCPIPLYVYSGRTDNIVRRESAQSVFPNAEVLPGDHFSILDPDAPGHLTAQVLKRHLLDNLAPGSPTDERSVGKRPISNETTEDTPRASAGAQESKGRVYVDDTKGSPRDGNNVQAGNSYESPMHDLAIRYNVLREAMLSGDRRTEAMADIVRELRNLLREALDFDIAKYLSSSDRGLRLAAYAYLQEHEVPQYRSELVRAVYDEDKPFGQYVGLEALRNQGRTAERLDEDNLSILSSLAQRLGPGEDRTHLINDIVALERSKPCE